MIHAKSSRYGLEVQVYMAQLALENNLFWEGTVNIYGLLFENAKRDNYILEAWDNERNYVSVFNNDKVTAEVGFIEVSRDVINRVAVVDVVCTVNLEKAYDQKIRDNERAYLQFKNALIKINKVTGFERGVKDVFSSINISNIKYLDMQPFDVFKYTVSMSYLDNVC